MVLVWVIERLGGLVGDYSVTWPRSMPRSKNVNIFSKIV